MLKLNKYRCRHMASVDETVGLRGCWEGCRHRMIVSH